MAYTLNYRLGRKTQEKSHINSLYTPSNVAISQNFMDQGSSPPTTGRLSGRGSIHGKHLMFPGQESAQPTGEKLTGTFKKKAKIVGSHDVMCLKFDRSGTTLATGFSDGLIKLYDVTKAQPQVIRSIPARDIYPATCIRFFPSPVRWRTTDADLAIATYACGVIRFWDMNTGKMLSEINEMRRSKCTTSAAFSPTGEHMATVGGDSQIHLYDVKTSKRISTLESSDTSDAVDGHRSRTFAIQFDPTNPNVFISGGWDKTVQYWDRRNKSSFKRIFGPFICGDSLDLDARENKILTGSWRNENPLEIWDYATGKKLTDVSVEPALSSKLYCCQWLGNDHIVAGGSGSNAAKVINRQALMTSGTLTNLHHAVYCMDNDRNAKLPCVAVGTENCVYLLNVVAPDALKYQH